MSSYNPFWFANEELLADLLRAEIHSIAELFARHPDVREFFDLPEANVQHRAACFALLAHRELMREIDETLVGRYVQPPSLSDEEKDILRRSQNLFADDAPAWVLEVDQVAELLPARIYDALPQPLREGGFGFDSNNSTQVETIRASAKTLSSVEQIQALTAKVVDAQLQRLEGRWAAAHPVANQAGVPGRVPIKRKGRRTRDKQRMFRDKLIAEIDDVSPTTGEFLKLMDERKVKPQPTWSGWPGSWSQAYRDPRLRALIHKDKSRALARVRNR